MDKPKLTEWLNSIRRPTRIGYYDTRTRAGEMVLFWDGANWRASKHSPRSALNNHFWSPREWRGLAEQPKEQSNG